MISARLLRAYRATRYSAASADVCIGWRSASMDALLRRHAAATGVFITAWNPRSHRMPEGWNRRMQARLAQRLRRVRVLPADGVWRRWHEAHFLVLAPPALLRPLARLFRQNALVVAHPRRPARLLLA